MGWIRRSFLTNCNHQVVFESEITIALEDSVLLLGALM